MSQISTKPPSGFRDFLPRDMRLREHVFGVIKDVYRAHGFEQIDTPVLENLNVLLGKYGDEGDQLLFKVMKRKDKLQHALEADQPGELDLADMGLRYDLTVPLARVVAQYQPLEEVPKIFKRFHIAPVWRADRPQRGRFREFYQCDVDIVGSTSMIAEAEVISALAEVLRRLAFGGVRIHLNNRQLLGAMMRYAGVDEALRGSAMVAIDKFDKIGADGVRAELADRQIADTSADKLMELLALAGQQPAAARNDEVLARLREVLEGDAAGEAALSDLAEVLALTQSGPAAGLLVLDPMLARGLSYYTGSIFEIRSDDFSGSLGGGGRYDELIGMFGKVKAPACGFSLGVERILMLMRERGQDAALGQPIDVVVTVWHRAQAPESLAIAQELRAAGLSVDVFPGHAKGGKKIGNQLGYANDRGAVFALIAGPNEINAGQVKLKDMRDGSERVIDRGDLTLSVIEGLDAN